MHPPQGIIKKEGYGAADIHIHSTASDGMASVVDILEFVAQKGELDVIAITDHGEIKGSYEARELAAKRNYPFEVVVGMELNTLDGHLLAVFLEKSVPSGKHIVETIAAVHAQGGLCIAPHPTSPFSESINLKDIEDIIKKGDPGIYFDGIETFNATIMGKFSNNRIKKINEKYKLAEMSSSDAHFLICVGSGYTLFPGHTAADLRKGILERTTIPMQGHYASYFQIGLMQIIRQQSKSRSFFFRGMIKNAVRSMRK